MSDTFGKGRARDYYSPPDTTGLRWDGPDRADPRRERTGLIERPARFRKQAPGQKLPECDECRLAGKCSRLAAQGGRLAIPACNAALPRPQKDADRLLRLRVLYELDELRSGAYLSYPQLAGRLSASESDARRIARLLVGEELVETKETRNHVILRLSLKGRNLMRRKREQAATRFGQDKARVPAH